MAWTAPRTWVTGELVTAALLNTHLRDNLNAAFPVGVDAWTAYTPTLTQTATVTKTVTYAKYMKIGRLVIAQVKLDVTGAGTAGVGINIGLPLTGAGVVNMAVGAGAVFDASAGFWYAGDAILLNTTTVFLMLGSGGVASPIGASGMTAALASGDIVTYMVSYESAT